MRLFLVLLLFSSCLRHPRPEEDKETPLAAQIKIEQGLDNPLFSPIGDKTTWWEDLKDLQLKALIEETLNYNPKSLIADAKIRLAKAEALLYGAKMLPEASFTIDAMNVRQSKTGIFGFTPVIPYVYKQYEGGIKFDYEFDFWEKNQNRMRAAIGEYRALWAEQDQARLVLSITVADYYWQWMILEKREAVFQQIISNQLRLVEIENERKRRNVASLMTIIPLEETLYAYEAGLHKIIQKKEEVKNKLLAIVSPDLGASINVVPVQVDDQIPVHVPENLPLNILHRRPDLTALKWHAESKDRLRLSAQAEFFPNINIAGLVGLQTLNPQKLFRGESHWGQWGPAINLPIFTGGALAANYFAKDEETLIAILQYEQGVRDALEQTVTALSDVKELDARYNENRAKSEKGRKFHELVAARKKGNLNSISDVIRAQIEYLRSKDEEYKTEALLFRACLDLTRATGGFYHE